MKLLANTIGNSDNETNFLHNLLLTDGLFSELRKFFGDKFITSYQIIKNSAI